jgi:hypothetical protein
MDISILNLPMFSHCVQYRLFKKNVAAIRRLHRLESLDDLINLYIRHKNFIRSSIFFLDLSNKHSVRHSHFLSIY